MKKILFFILVPLLSYGQTQIGQDINGESEGDRSGRSVSLSSDGTIVAIGAPNNNGNSSDSGHVRVFENENGTWVQIGQDIDGEAEGDDFGFDVSLSSDGTIVAIGALRNDTNGEDSGKVQVYENVDGTWIQLGQDLFGDAASDQFGGDIDLSSDGNFLAIGASQNDEDGNNSGQVKIYQIQDNIWTQIGEDIFGENPGDRCGDSVSFSEDANKIAISSSLFNGDQENVGQVRVFEFIDDVWTQIGQGIEGEAFNDQSGFSIDLSSDGSIVAIGAPANDGNGIVSGHVRIYRNEDNIWTQIGEDIDGENEVDQSGTVSLSSNGTIIAIGAFCNSDNGSCSGHVRVYKNVNDTWIQVGEDIDGENETDLFGSSVSLSSDGSIVAIGGTGYDDNGEESGQVRVYDLSGPLSTEEITETSFKLFPNPATTTVTIQLDQDDSLEKAIIYNNLGQFVKEVTTPFIDTSDLSRGLYFIEVITNQGKASRKLIIE